MCVWIYVTVMLKSIVFDTKPSGFVVMVAKPRTVKRPLWNIGLRKITAEHYSYSSLKFNMI